ncbi:hypothetical protein [Henriciella pelagia]|uniref:hypothetical protein n=1 Tax=Henriciella pelagia TaxID=1977912 RepID=UPI003F496204
MADAGQHKLTFAAYPHPRQVNTEIVRHFAGVDSPGRAAKFLAIERGKQECNVGVAKGLAIVVNSLDPHSQLTARLYDCSIAVADVGDDPRRPTVFYRRVHDCGRRREILQIRVNDATALTGATRHGQSYEQDR